MEISREDAIKRIENKRGFSSHLAVYLIVNALLVGIWYFTDRSYFWPVWPMMGWGIGVFLHMWSVYFQRPISESEIRREMEKGR